jgi:hypothetical protein
MQSILSGNPATILTYNARKTRPLYVFWTGNYVLTCSSPWPWAKESNVSRYNAVFSKALCTLYGEYCSDFFWRPDSNIAEMKF